MKKATEADRKDTSLKQCETCGKSYPANTFINGNGDKITWCQKCGASMVTALQMW